MHAPEEKVFAIRNIEIARMLLDVRITDLWVRDTQLVVGEGGVCGTACGDVSRRCGVEGLRGRRTDAVDLQLVASFRHLAGEDCLLVPDCEFF